jgi:hypothetical protein
MPQRQPVSSRFRLYACRNDTQEHSALGLFFGGRTLLSIPGELNESWESAWLSPSPWPMFHAFSSGNNRYGSPA